MVRIGLEQWLQRWPLALVIKTIRYIILVKWMRNVSSIKSKPRSGRPPKTDEEKDQQLAEAAMAALTQPLRVLNRNCSSGNSNAHR